MSHVPRGLCDGRRYRLADENGDNQISYTEFIPILKKLLRVIYQRTTLDWNDWCQVRITHHVIN